MDNHKFEQDNLCVRCGYTKEDAIHMIIEHEFMESSVMTGKCYICLKPETSHTGSLENKNSAGQKEEWNMRFPEDMQNMQDPENKEHPRYKDQPDKLILIGDICYVGKYQTKINVIRRTEVMVSIGGWFYINNITYHLQVTVEEAVKRYAGVIR